ncbi:MAG: flagellar basal body P-ring protein FlgI [Candidatus Riflebacteria bacterium]|nr:flagellar basal body P-ring protein FlgI [Candidatus Riflebacteria bacterium]
MVRIKVIAILSGQREYQLVGYGLVTGLNGTGDKSQMSLDMVRGMLRNMGMEIDVEQIISEEESFGDGSLMRNNAPCRAES